MILEYIILVIENAILVMEDAIVSCTIVCDCFQLLSDDAVALAAGARIANHNAALSFYNRTPRCKDRIHWPTPPCFSPGVVIKLSLRRCQADVTREQDQRVALPVV